MADNQSEQFPLQRLHQVFEPSSHISDLEDRNRVRLFLFVLAFTLVAFVGSSLIGDTNSTGIIFVGSVLLYLLARSRYYRVAIGLAVLFLSTPSLIILWVHATDYSHFHIFLVAAWLVVPIVLTGLVSTFISTIIAVAGLNLAILTIAAARHVSVDPFVLPIAFLSIVGIMIIIATYVRSQYATQVKQQIIQLRESNTLLESRVTQRTKDLKETIQELLDEITHHQQTQKKLAQARDEALTALQLRTEILAKVSHDARTPLNVIMLRTEMLKRDYFGPLTQKQRDAINTIMLSTQQSTQFIENLLDEAQLNSGKIQIRNAEFDLRQLLKDVETLMQPLAEDKGLDFSVTHTPESPTVIVSDKRRLSQILQNLVANAIKFTDQGHVCIHASHKDDLLILRISDTGSGIAVEDQNKVFEAFEQVDGSMTREQNRGIGLGLSIVKQLVQLMGGTIILTSQLGNGSTFELQLPLKHDAAEEAING